MENKSDKNNWFDEQAQKDFDRKLIEQMRENTLNPPKYVEVMSGILATIILVCAAVGVIAIIIRVTFGVLGVWDW